MTNLTHKLLLLLTALLLAAGAFFASQYLHARDAYLRAESQIQSDQATLTALAKQQSELAAQLKQTQADQQSQLAALHKDFAHAQSPQQLADLISNAMSLPQPIQIRTPVPTPEQPDPQPVAEVPLPDAPQAKAFLEACQECQINLSAAEKESQLAAVQAATLKQQLALAQKERDTWKHAAQGGTWARRAAKRAAAFAIDAAITAAAVCATHHCK
jgi:hypothetical protein